MQTDLAEFDVAAGRSVSAVVRDIGGNVHRIVSAELRLAIAEFRGEMASVGTAAVLAIFGGLCAFLALTFACLGAMFALATMFPLWGAAIIIGLALGAFSFLLLLSAKAQGTRALSTWSSATPTLATPAP